MWDLSLRSSTVGLCKDSLLDKKYTWTKEVQGGFYVFRGYKNAYMFFSQAESVWKIALYSTNATYAVVNTTDYPFGLHKWTIHGDACLGGGEKERVLSFSTCCYNEFNCDSGQCVTMERRCDGVLDCADNSGRL